MNFLIYAHTYPTDLIQFELTPTFQMGFLGRDVHVLVRVVQSLIFCALFCRCCLSFCPFSFDHCVFNISQASVLYL
jgi:hypothetical protein